MMKSITNNPELREGFANMISSETLESQIRFSKSLKRFLKRHADSKSRHMASRTPVTQWAELLYSCKAVDRIPEAGTVEHTLAPKAVWETRPSWEDKKKKIVKDTRRRNKAIVGRRELWRLALTQDARCKVLTQNGLQVL